MKKIMLSIWSNLERVAMAILLGGFLINILLQIISRVFFNQPLFWTEEVSRYLFVWMVFLGLPFATKYDRHIRADFLVSRLPRTAQFIIDMLINVITTAVFLWIFIVGTRYIGYVSGSVTYALAISKAYVVLIIPLSAFLMLARLGEKYMLDVKKYTAYVREKKERETVK